MTFTTHKQAQCQTYLSWRHCVKQMLCIFIDEFIMKNKEKVKIYFKKSK